MLRSPLLFYYTAIITGQGLGLKDLGPGVCKSKFPSQKPKLPLEVPSMRPPLGTERWTFLRAQCGVLSFRDPGDPKPKSLTPTSLNPRTYTEFWSKVLLSSVWSLLLHGPRGYSVPLKGLGFRVLEFLGCMGVTRSP